MSLQVWLPLNGSLENRGLEQNYKIEKAISGYADHTTLISNTVNGKVTPTSYKWELNGQAISINKYMNQLKKYSTYSISCWLYYTDKSSHEAMAICSSGDWNVVSGKFNFALWGHNGTGYTKILVPSTVAAWNGAVITLNNPSTIQPNKWYHLCLTCDSKIFKLYINGILQENQYDCSQNSTIPSSPSDENLFIGCATYYNGMTIKGSINDFRIYDHCLSPREVKLLAQGLVAHYKLNYNEQPNLFLNGLEEEGDSSTSSYYRYVFDYEGYGKYLQANEKCTLTICFTPKEGFNSFNPHVSQGWTSPTGETDSIVTTGQQQIISIKSKEQWNYATDRNLTPQDGRENANWYIYVRNKSGDYDTSVVDIHWVKLQAGHCSDVQSWTPSISEDEEYYLNIDCSGYDNHLAKVGNITLEENSPRYVHAINFNQSGYFKTDNFNLTAQQFTCAFWIKAPSNIITNQHFLFGTHNNWTGNGFSAWRDKNNTSYSVIIRSDEGAIDATHQNPWAGFSFSFTPDTWEHIVYTYTGTELIGYKNGIEFNRDTYGNNGNVRLPVLYLGNSLFNNASTSETDEASMSDFRIYATALSAAAVKELYESSISFLNNGTLQCSEIVEKNTNLKYNKNGIVQTKEIKEANTNLKLYNDKIQTFQIYEL